MAYKQLSPIAVIEGGTGATSLTDHGVLIGSGTGAITAASVGTNGQALIGSTGADPVFATIASSDSLLTLTGGAGTLDITANQAVSAASTITDNVLVRGDGGTRGVQNSTISVTDNGEMTNTSQPAFFAHLGTTDSNETGDGTFFFLGDTDVGTALTEILDQNGDFTPGASGGAVFTAPVAGVYSFGYAVFFQGLTSSHTTGEIRYIRGSDSSSDALSNFANVRNSSNTASFIGSFILYMDASDTIKIRTQVSGGSKVVDISGALYDTAFWGALLC